MQSGPTANVRCLLRYVQNTVAYKMAEENFAKSLQKYQETLGQTKLNIEKLNRFAKILQAQNRLVQVKKIGARKLKQKKQF